MQFSFCLLFSESYWFSSHQPKQPEHLILGICQNLLLKFKVSCYLPYCIINIEFVAF